MSWYEVDMSWYEVDIRGGRTRSRVHKILLVFS